MAEYRLTPTQSRNIKTLADLDRGLDIDAIHTDFDAGRCPWCDAGPFRQVPQHAAQKHPEQYREYQEAVTDD